MEGETYFKQRLGTSKQIHNLKSNSQTQYLLGQTSALVRQSPKTFSLSIYKQPHYIQSNPIHNSRSPSSTHYPTPLNFPPPFPTSTHLPSKQSTSSPNSLPPSHPPGYSARAPQEYPQHHPVSSGYPDEPQPHLQGCFAPAQQEWN